MSGPFTERQREVLKRRLAFALSWADRSTAERDRALYLAEVVIKDMESGFLDAAAQRRAVVNLAERLEKSA